MDVGQNLFLTSIFLLDFFSLICQLIDVKFFLAKSNYYCKYKIYSADVAIAFAILWNLKKNITNVIYAVFCDRFAGFQICIQPNTMLLW